MLLGDIQERGRIQRQNNADYIREIWDVSGYPIVELIKRFNQGYTLTSPVEQHRNIKNNNEALTLRAIIEALNNYTIKLGAEYNYEHTYGTKEREERAWDCYVVARNIQIKIKDILNDYGIYYIDIKSKETESKET